MYEDVEIECAAFGAANRVFCIASAGDTALRLASRHEVVACDLNPVQLQYAQARVHGARLRLGDAERTIGMARQLAPFAGWRASKLQKFLAMQDLEEQTLFWRQQLDTPLFRAGCDMLLSYPALRIIYSAKFLQVLPPHFGSVVRRRLARGFALFENAWNPYARRLLLGELMELPCEPSPCITFVHHDAASYLESCAEGSFDGLSLSNILDGATPAYRARLARAVRHAASSRAVVVWRSFAEPPGIRHTNLAAEDRALLWGIVDVRPARDFTGELA
jgi:S-adenosylmethionine:diacylglycerol 3-amino-3-carboxypropyl transferase